MQSGIIFDVIVVLICATFIVRGFIRGLSGEIFSLAGTIGGVFLAWRFSSPLSSLVSTRIDLSPTVILLIIVILLYLSVVILAVMACKLVKAFLRFTQLSFVDRILGGVAGILKTCAIILFVYFLMLSFSPIIPASLMKQSITVQTVERIWPDIATIMQEHGFFLRPLLDRGLPSTLTSGENTSNDISRGNSQ